MKNKITIPEPCHENWDEMTPKNNGRFCLSCSKTVIDFTTMLPEEVQHFFIQNQNQNICGRFKKSQLDTITIQIPSRILFTQTHYHKMFLLALFIAMGTTLFSCADKNGNKKKIDKIEVVENPNNVTVGEVMPRNNNSNNPLLPPPPPPKVDQVKFVKGKNKIKNVKIHQPVPIKCEKTTEDNNTEDVIYNGLTAIVVGPDFPGGIEQFYAFFANEFNRPENTNNSNIKIKVSFAVERDGSLSYVAPLTAIDNGVEEEIIRVLKLSPKWKPGESNGKKIKMVCSLPITFEKDSSETSK